MRYFLLSLLFFPTFSFSVVDLRSTAEKSQWKQTGRYSETTALCKAFEKKYPDDVHCETFGVTPEGRKMVSLIVSTSGVHTPLRAKSRKIPVVFFQGGIHAGEIDGKDAGFWLLREWLESETQREILKKVTLVFVPVFNVDGHERFGRNHRPNQNGPEEMGWRVTSQNLNLNRDYVKADAPEMQAMLKLLRRWDPLVYFDLHVTDGAQFQQDIGVMVNPTFQKDYPMRETGLRIERESLALLKEKGFLPVPFYPSFVVDDEPTSGFEVGISPPRFSQSYWGLRNRIGILIETHSWRPFAHRVRATRVVLESVISQAAREGAEWRTKAKEADEKSANLAGLPIELTFEPGEKKTEINFEGYEYRIEDSPITGQKIIRYDPTKPQTWKVPFLPEVKAKLIVTAPKGGYLVPTQWAEKILAKLDFHGVKYHRLSSERAPTKGEGFHLKQIEYGKTSYEGRQQATVKGEWKAETVTAPKGSVFIPINQPLARLIVHLFEPEAPDSFVAWGFFNSAFERKEYIESYVLEPWASELLAKDPKVKQAFDSKLKTDADFKKDSEKRLDFFFEQHPAWDASFLRYPVARVSWTR